MGPISPLSWGSRRLRWLFLSTLVVTSVLVLLAGLHLRPVRMLILGRAMALARSTAGVELTVDELSYNLLTLDVRLRGVSARAAGAGEPFAAADTLRINLPASVLRGRLSLESIDADGLAIRLVRAADGTLNLPTSGSEGAATARFDIGRVHIQGAHVSYVDAANGVRVAADDVTLDLTPARGVSVGRLTARRGLSIRVGDVALDGTLDGQVAYDGVSVTATELSSTSSLGRLQLAGRLDVFGATPSLEVTARGAALLEPLSAALRLEPGVRGTVEFNARASGLVVAPTATMTMASNGIGWRHLTASALSLQATATTEVLTVDSLTTSVADGELTGRGRLRFDTMRADAAVDVTGLSAAAMLGPDVTPTIGARLSGRATFDADVEQGLSDLRLTARISAARTPGRPGTIPLAGDLSLDVSEGRWRVRHRNVVNDAVTVGGDLSGQVAPVVFDSTLGGTVRATAAGSDRLIDLLRRADITVPAWIDPEGGRLDLTVALAGTLGAPAGAGRATVSDLRLGGSAPISASLVFSADRQRVSAADVTATVGRNAITGDAAVTLGSGAIRGRFDVDLQDFAALGTALADVYSSGQVNAQLTLGGTRSRPDVHATLTGSGLEAARQQLGSLSAQLSYAGETLSADAIELRQPDGGRLQASGSYLLGSGRYDISLDARAAHVSPVETSAGSWPVSVVIDGQLRARGTLDRPDGGGHLTLTDVRWNDAQIDRADADITLSAAGIRATVDVPSLAAALDARVEPRAPYAFTATVRANDSPLDALIRSVGGATSPALELLSGRIRATVEARGTLDDVDTIAADIVADRLDVQSGKASLQLQGPATARYAASALSVGALRLRTGATGAEVTGAVGPASSTGLTVSLQGDLADLRPWLVVAGLPTELEGSGAVTLRARARGSLERLAIDGEAQVNDARVLWPGYPPIADISAAVTLRDDLLDVSTMRARLDQSVLEGSARVPLSVVRDTLPRGVAAAVTGAGGPATLTARVTGITPATIQAITGTDAAQALTGTATLQVDLEAEGAALDAVRGTLTLTDFRATASGLPIDQVRPTRLELSAGTVSVTDWTWNVAGSQVTVGGHAGLTGERALDLLVDGRLDLRVLGAFLPSVTTGGTGDVAVAIRGSVAAPQAEGTVRLADGELQLSDPRLGLTNGRGLLLLEANRVNISRLEGVVNGGLLRIAGDIGYAGTTLTGGSLSIDADGVALDVPVGMRTEVDAALTAAIGDRVQISGRVDIVRGAYREPLSLAATLASMARQQEAARATDGSPSAAAQIDLNVTVASATDLIVDNNYGRMDLGLDLRLVGTAAAPSVVGRATIREGGQLYLGGQTYLVERGTIDFSNPREIVPDVDLSARTRVNGLDETGAATEYDITLAVAGTPDTLDTTLSSEPARSQADIVSLLATGRLADQVGGMSGALARDQILGYLSGEALGFAARAVGLDSIRLERGVGQDLAMQTDPSIAGEVNPAQRLTLGRRLSGGVEVTLSQNLRDTGQQTWVVAYKPVQPVEVRAISRDDRSRSYELRHDVALGGPKPPARERPTEVPSRISAVRITGNTVFPDAELARVLSLEAGDRFEFDRWQRDRDRLRRFYLDRDYREVRIAARQLRQAGDTPRPELALEYDIDAGPLTAIEVEGHRLTDRALERLGEVWSNTIVDVALADDLTATTRHLMAQDGYFGADVHVARVVSAEPDGAKRMQIRIAPGERSASRVLQVTGNTHVSESEVEAAADRLGIDAWLAPRTLADEVALLYRQRGLLAAAVTAGPLRVEGATAVLPIRIDEGPRFTVGRIVVSGARQRSADDVRGDLGVSEGLPYAPDDLNRARASLTRAYARAGFNAMTATVDARVDRGAGTVDVVVHIDEGPRQVLEEVAVSGGEGVNAGTVAGALSLTPGTPVDLESWYESRRRLSQTGLFRRIDIEPTRIDGAQAADGVEPVRADVTLVRRQPWRFRYGVDISDDAAPIASQGRAIGGGLNANIERYGLFGWPGSGSASLRYNKAQRSARGGVSWPSLFGRSVASRLYLSRSRDLVEGENVLSFISDRTSVTAEQRMPVGRNTIVAWAYQFERNHVFDPNADPDDPFAINERWEQARLTSSVVFDTRSDPFDPSRGLLHSSNVEYGLEVLGRSGRFITYSLQQLVFMPLTRGIVSASGVRLNMGRGFDQDLILSERFYAGGVNTVRGYPENALGGVDYFGDPVPGQAALVLNEEIRFPLFRWIRGTGFVDAGDVYPKTSDLSLGSLQYSAGAGLRFATPVGLFRVDVAMPLPKQNRPPQWYFAFGHIF